MQPDTARLNGSAGDSFDPERGLLFVAGGGVIDRLSSGFVSDEPAPTEDIQLCRQAAPVDQSVFLKRYQTIPASGKSSTCP
jgi:hypothetical protein